MSHYNINTTMVFKDLDELRFENDLKTLENVLRAFSLLTHVFYFILVFTITELKSTSLVYIHQLNFYGMLFSLHYCLYFKSKTPQIGSNALNETLCTISELTWANLKFLRSFSILELAIFRLAALIWVKTFKEWIKSPWRIACSILVNILISLAFNISLKFILSTTHGPSLCYDGFSSNLTRSIAYFTISSTIGIILPCTLVFLIYVYKINYLRDRSRSPSMATNFRFFLAKTTGKRTNEVYRDSTDLEPQTANFNPDSIKTNQRYLARQILVMNAFLILSSLSFILTNVANIYEQLEASLFSLRITLRIFTIFFQSLVPIVSITGHTRMMLLVRVYNWRRVLIGISNVINCPKNNRITPQIQLNIMNSNNLNLN